MRPSVPHLTQRLTISRRWPPSLQHRPPVEARAQRHYRRLAQCRVENSHRRSVRIASGSPQNGLIRSGARATQPETAYVMTRVRGIRVRMERTSSERVCGSCGSISGPARRQEHAVGRGGRGQSMTRTTVGKVGDSASFPVLGRVKVGQNQPIAVEHSSSYPLLAGSTSARPARQSRSAHLAAARSHTPRTRRPPLSAEGVDGSGAVVISHYAAVNVGIASRSGLTSKLRHPEENFEIRSVVAQMRWRMACDRDCDEVAARPAANAREPLHPDPQLAPCCHRFEEAGSSPDDGDNRRQPPARDATRRGSV